LHGQQLRRAVGPNVQKNHRPCRPGAAVTKIHTFEFFAGVNGISVATAVASIRNPRTLTAAMSSGVSIDHTHNIDTITTATLPANFYKFEDLSSIATIDLTILRQRPVMERLQWKEAKCNQLTTHSPTVRNRRNDTSPLSALGQREPVPEGGVWQCVQQP